MRPHASADTALHRAAARAPPHRRASVRGRHADARMRPTSHTAARPRSRPAAPAIRPEVVTVFMVLAAARPTQSEKFTTASTTQRSVLFPDHMIREFSRITELLSGNRKDFTAAVNC